MMSSPLCLRNYNLLHFVSLRFSIIAEMWQMKVLVTYINYTISATIVPQRKRSWVWKVHFILLSFRPTCGACGLQMTTGHNSFIQSLCIVAHIVFHGNTFHKRIGEVIPIRNEACVWILLHLSLIWMVQCKEPNDTIGNRDHLVCFSYQSSFQPKLHFFTES